MQSNKLPELTNPFLEIDNARTKQILFMAKTLQQSLLRQLSSIGEETPDLFDFGNTQILRKNELVKRLKKACQWHLFTLDDVTAFIDKVSKVHQEIKDIDLNCKLSLTLNNRRNELSTLDTAVYYAKADIPACKEYMLIILRHMKSRINTPTESWAFDYYSMEIEEMKKSLIKKYICAYQFVTGYSFADAKEIASNKAKTYFAELDKTLYEFLQNQASQQHFLNLQQLPYHTRTQNIDPKCVARTVFNTVIHSFAGNLKYEEINLLWEKHNQLNNDIDARRRSITEFNTKLQWYKSTIQEEYGLDSLYTKELIFNLNNICSKITQFDAAIFCHMSALQDLQEHVKRSSNETPIISKEINELQHHYCKILDSILTIIFKQIDKALKRHFKQLGNIDNDTNKSFIFAWKNQLSDIINNLKDELVIAKKLLIKEMIHDAQINSPLTQYIVDTIRSPFKPENICHSTTLSTTQDDTSILHTPSSEPDSFHPTI